MGMGTLRLTDAQYTLLCEAVDYYETVLEDDGPSGRVTGKVLALNRALDKVAVAAGRA